MIRHSLTLLLALFFGFQLVSCSTPEITDETKGWSAEKLYAEARLKLDETNYEKAIIFYQKLESRFPYGRFAQQAQIEMLYAHYKDKDPAGTIAEADRFIKNHPNHPSLDYVYYLKGLANFNEDLGIFGFVSNQDMTERDPKMAKDAFDSFKQLVARFPQSKYAPDSIQRMEYLVNALASFEVHVARYYYNRKAYLATANRVQYCLKTYPEAPANEEGLLLMVKSYDALGLNDLRSDAERIMIKNFPKSKYLNGSYKRDVPWWQIWN